jgi:mono/diheme cytochrome c family protein
MRLTCLLLLAAAVAFGCASRKATDHIYAGPDDLKSKYAPDWAAAGDMTGDAEAGKTLYWGEEGDIVPCASCHSFNVGDTMTSDGDGQIRAGVSLFAARHREDTIALSQSFSRDGIKVVVPYWHDGPTGMVGAQQMADLDAYLASQAGEASHATSANVPYESRRYTVPAGTTGGNIERGKDLAYAYCGTCHEVDGKIPVYPMDLPKLKGGVVSGGKLMGLAKRIRNADGTYNKHMPGFPDDRMPESDLLDLLAYFAK